MAVNVNDVKQLVEQLANKDQKTGYVTAARFNRYAKAAQLDIITNQRRMFEAGTISSDNLSDLKTRTSLNVDPTDGTLTTPTDYLYFSAMYVNAFYKNKQGKEFDLLNAVEVVPDDQWAQRLSSQIAPPSKQYPIAVEYDGFFTFFPKDAGTVDLVYLKEPLDPWWNYTVSSNVQVYAATGGSTTNPNDGGTGSTQFELPEQFRNDLAYKICEYLGITVQDANLFQGQQVLKQDN